MTRKQKTSTTVVLGTTVVLFYMADQQGCPSDNMRTLLSEGGLGGGGGRSE